MYTPCIGIDFGTTKTLVAYSLSQGNRPEIAHLGRERNNLPTSAFISESGIWEFGDDADDYACDAALADRYISGFKLKLGSTTPALQVFGEQGFQAFSAQRISSLFFAHVREKCTKEVFNGRAVSRAVITHPVKFSPAQLHDLRNAAEQAGFSDVTLMREPEAAGLAFCRLCPQDLFSGTALIVDWGGGTLDLALVSRKTDAVQIHNNYVAGHNHIGGNEFDELLWKYVNAGLQHEKGVKLSDDSVDFQRLQKKKVRAAKEKLSRTDSAMLSFSGKQGAYPTVKLTRAELETVLKPAIQTGVGLILHLLNSIQESSLKPSQVLLIGGSSRIPLISRLIEESTQIPCRRWQYSHEAVALGAAICAATRNRHEDDARSLSVVPNFLSSYIDAAKLGQASAQCQLGDYYMNGQYVPKDDVEAVEWYKKAAMQGMAEAQYKLGLCYSLGTGVQKNHDSAAQWYIKAAEQGNREAQNALGECYEKGEGVPQHPAKAADWYAKSACQGYSAAQHALGWCYEMGVGVERNVAMSVEWYTKAAQQGERWSQFNLGLFYLNGTGVCRNAAKAVELFTLAAEQGLPQAQHNLAHCYLSGVGVTKNETRGGEWLMAAARQGFADAQFSLALYCYQVGGDDATIMQLLSQAVAQGHKGAQEILHQYS